MKTSNCIEKNIERKGSVSFEHFYLVTEYISIIANNYYLADE